MTPDGDSLPTPPTVLIVDDHAVFRSTARALLEFDGFDVVGEAGDAAAGLAAARALDPDLVLIDVRLPDLDGFAAAERLSGGGPRPAIVLTSSSDDPLYPERARRAGARGFVAKHDLSGAALLRLLG
jgi:two-component system nitrate/nitrite response regulator NarL